MYTTFNNFSKTAAGKHTVLEQRKLGADKNNRLRVRAKVRPEEAAEGHVRHARVRRPGSGQLRRAREGHGHLEHRRHRVHHVSLNK